MAGKAMMKVLSTWANSWRVCHGPPRGLGGSGAGELDPDPSPGFILGIYKRSTKKYLNKILQNYENERWTTFSNVIFTFVSHFCPMH